MIHTLVVRDENDLRRIMQLRRSRVTMAMSRFEAHQNRELEARINGLLSECGCRLSAIFILISVGLLIVGDVLEWSRISGHLTISVGIELSLVVALAVAGKLLGIAMARQKLRSIVAALIAELMKSPRAVAAPAF